MKFGGRLYAGMSLFQGRDMFFNYEKFQVEFDSVRHLDFYVPTGELDQNKQPVANAMNSHLEYVSGALLVDAPGNKSGKEDLGIFPSLQSKETLLRILRPEGYSGGRLHARLILLQTRPVLL
jgi:hypothetical protein